MSNACCEQTITLSTATTADVLAALAAAGSSVSVNNQLLTNVATPVSDTDAANKAYVDAVGVGLRQFKASVRAATTANITLSGTQTIDGVAVIALDRVLVKNQAAGAENGIYVCAAGAWARATDADTSAEVTSGMYCFVDEGSTNADSGWVLATNNPIVLATTALTFTKFTSIGGDVVGPSSSVDNAIPRFDLTGGKTLQTSGLTISDADLLSIPNTAGAGIAIHNTADQATNYERLFVGPSGNVFYSQVEKGGSGTARNYICGSGTGGGNASLTALGTGLLLNASSSNGTTTLSGTVTTGAGPVHTFTNNGSFSSGAAVQPIVSITGTINQSGSGGYKALLVNVTESATGSGTKSLASFEVGGSSKFVVTNGGTISASGNIQFLSGTAMSAGGTTGNGLKFSSTTNFGVFGGSGAPTLSAAKGSLYLRSDGSGTNDRFYFNTDGGTTWTAGVTVA